MSKHQPASSQYVRVVAGFCGMLLLAAGSLLILGEILYRVRQFGTSALAEFDGPALLALFAATTVTLAVITLVMVRRMIRGHQ